MASATCVESKSPSGIERTANVLHGKSATRLREQKAEAICSETLCHYVFDLPMSRVRDLCERAARRQQETEQEQILAVDLGAKTYTFSRSDCIMESIRSKLDPHVRIRLQLSEPRDENDSTSERILGESWNCQWDVPSSDARSDRPRKIQVQEN
jgi:hypothetical protein